MYLTGLGASSSQPRKLHEQGHSDTVTDVLYGRGDVLYGRRGCAVWEEAGQERHGLN